MKRLLQGVVFGAVCGLCLLSLAAPRAAVAESPAQEPGSDLAVRVTPAMEHYSYTRYALYFVGVAAQAAVWWLLLRSGIGPRLRGFAERRTRQPLLQAAIVYPAMTLVYSAALLPLSLYSSFLLPHQYGLSTQTGTAWLLDRGKGWAISALLGVPVAALWVWTVRRSPHRWWVGFWLASIPLMVFSLLLGPLLIDPLFNRFQPLRNERLRDRILGLAARAGIEQSRVFEVDASRRTNAVNAYVTGIGGSARIVLWDTLLERLDEDETASVMAHEMGHYVERHVLLGLLAACIGSLGVLWAVDRAGRFVLARRGAQWGLRGLDDLAALPLIMLMILALNFFGSPVEGAVSRYFENRADEFELRLTGDGKAAARSFVKLAEQNLSLPNPPAFIEFWMFSHPPLARRIERALAFEDRRGPGHPPAESE